ncbi:MAG: hypothetical protein MUF53_12660 [Gemmatimonadaceae bacterium]|nr:hypothetical protein [Gemmatimonadaceae bacterium]
MRFRRTCLALALAAASAFAAPAFASTVPELPVGDFFKDAEFTAVSMSPKGTYLAVSVPQGDRTVLAILKTADLSIQSKFDYGANRHIEDIFWVSDERFAMAVFEQNGRFDFRIPNSMHASNVDGSRRLEIPNGFSYSIVSTLRDDDRDLMVSRSPSAASATSGNSSTPPASATAAAASRGASTRPPAASSCRSATPANRPASPSSIRPPARRRCWRATRASSRSASSAVPMGSMSSPSNSWTASPATPGSMPNTRTPS